MSWLVKRRKKGKREGCVYMEGKLITRNTACPIVRANPAFLGHQTFPPVIPSPALMSIKLTSAEMQTNLSPLWYGKAISCERGWDMHG